jgi:hypothetical protein
MADMKINYYYLDHYELSQRTVKAYAPDAEWVYTARGYPHLYPDHVARSWNQGGNLLIIEGDIVVEPQAVQEMRECSADWCTFAYPLGSGRDIFPLGFGFTKWSAKFQREFPYTRVTFHGDGRNRQKCVPCEKLRKAGVKPCRDCNKRMCHFHQDAAFWHEMIKDHGNDVHPHVHGVLDHQHVQNVKRLAGFSEGILYWYEQTKPGQTPVTL